jgi:hypothetical protein
MPAIISSYREILSRYPLTKRFALGRLSWLLRGPCFLQPAKAAEPSIIVGSDPHFSLIQRNKPAHCTGVHFLDFAVVNRQWLAILSERGLSW